jgi:putative addiction module CopG family antidote
MPMRNVDLPDELDQFVQAKVESGLYENASEVVRTAIRTLEREERDCEARHRATGGNDQGGILRSAQEADASVSTRAAEQEWIRKNESLYRGAWVALVGSKLVAQGSSAKEVLKCAGAAGYRQPLVVHLPSDPSLPSGGW